ncbi:endonuclease domain-containing protein [Rhizobium rhizophilum]|uniref:Endonuclease domain-containing protein n=2 Tax=Rhizobium rhizophilum TaxID=1850373 RepID=A0ABY2R1F6_9HYPH|nr:endonuclease domain-containing protein [Rhizobium rhizophilum]
MDRFRRANAKRLRSTSTDAERKLWRHLWRIPIDGSHCRRQVPIGPYIADFACHQIGLIIELDGSQHAKDAELVRDAARTSFLEKQGYKVIRFWNAEVLTELEAVLDTIYAAVREREIFFELHPNVWPSSRTARPGSVPASNTVRQPPPDHPTLELRSDPPPQGEGG